MLKYFSLMVFVNCIGNLECNVNAGYSWTTLVKGIRDSTKDCLMHIHGSTTWQCLKEGSLNMFETIMSSDLIPLTNEIRLIRFAVNGSRSAPANDHFDISERMTQHSLSTWSKRILATFQKTFSTHFLQIDGKELITQTGKGRNRRRHQMLPMMVFGVTALGMVLVPMGFQFLAVLGGKALLMAKMALLLASINGLKRIATSGIHYGLYQVPPDSYNYYDRGDVQRPRSNQF